MEERIKEAIELLKRNGYFVKKYTQKMEKDEVANRCAETGYGDCMECSCFVCVYELF